MESIETPAADAVTFRTHRPGDLGMIVHRHGAIYMEEYGWADPSFEAVVAHIAADFLTQHDPERERCWIAETDGQFVGSIMVVREPDAPAGVEDCARLRVFLVDPKARGLGVGKKLLRLSCDFAREKGYKRITLRTESTLVVARSMYKREGFEVIEGGLSSFQPGSEGEVWEKVLE